jgi:hypothetical protein
VISNGVTVRTGGQAGVFGKLFATLFFLVFFAAGAFFTSLLIRDVAQSARTYSWRKTECRIESSHVTEDRRSGDSSPYQFEVEYNYSIGQRVYSSTRHTRAESRFADYNQAQRLVDRYPAGARSVCYVNPSNPTEAVLDRPSLWMALTLGFPLIFVAIGAGGVYFTWRSRGRPAEKARPISTVTSPVKAARFLAVFFSIFFVVGAAMSYGLFVRPIGNIVVARRWVETPCTIVSSQVQSHHGDGGTTYSVDLLYRYTVNGTEYKSSRYHFMGGSSGGYRGKAAIVARFSPGSRAVCYVNPRDPNDAVLERGFTSDLWFGLIPLVFALVGGGGLVYSRRLARRERSADPAARWLPKGGRVASDPTGSISMIQGGGPDSGPVILKPAAAPWLKFIGAIFIATFWNGIVSVFLFQVVKSWQRGRPEWFLTLFMIPFVLVGLVLIGMIAYYFLALFNPRPVLTASSKAVRLGDPLDVQWKMHGRVEVLEELRIFLEGREEATYRRGTSTSTDREVFATIELANVTAHADKRAGQGRVFIPATTMHSFESPNNKILWRLNVHGAIRRWPDVKEEFPIVLLPAAAKPPLPA